MPAEQITASMNPPPRPPKSSRPMMPATSDPPTPTRIVWPIDIGSLPGIAKRPSAPTISPVMTSRMMNVIMVSDVPSSKKTSPMSGELGPDVVWSPARRPGEEQLRGDRMLLRRLRTEDTEALFEAGRDPAIWAYLPYGPFETPGAMREYVAVYEGKDDPVFYALERDGRPQGVASYLRITPEHGVIEIGHIWFGSTLQRTTAATEAIFLLAHHAFDELGYRRLEWKCNALNQRSRRAAERFGFAYEGVFRNHMVVKGRNRDTAWYAITVEDWPAIRAAFERWLAASNFDAAGRQLTPLATSSTSSATD